MLPMDNGGLADGLLAKQFFGHETGHRGELRDDRPAFKSHALGAYVGKVPAPKAAQNEPKKMKIKNLTKKTHLLNPHLSMRNDSSEKCSGAAAPEGPARRR